MDVQAYCRGIYGDAASVSAVRTDAYSWRCTVRGREHMVDVNELCSRQFGPGYVAQIDDASDPYNWYCRRAAAEHGEPAPSSPGR
jgi:hypothetical protein